MLPIITTFVFLLTEKATQYTLNRVKQSIGIQMVDQLSIYVFFAKEEGFDCGARTAIVTQWQNITCCLFWSALFLLSDSLGFVCFSPLKYSLPRNRMFDSSGIKI